jgi:replicative DNA helicase
MAEILRGEERDLFGVVTPPLPHNVETEAALLGAMMIENRLIDPVADVVKAYHFFEPLHGRIFEAILAAASLGRTANPVTLKTAFVDDPGMKEVGGAGSYLAMMTGSGASVIGALDFARHIKELAQLRAIIGGMLDIVGRARDTSGEINPDALVAEAFTLLSDVSEAGGEGDARSRTAAEAINDLIETFGKSEHGVTSGLDALDRTLGPIRAQDMTVLAGRPSMGKTATAISYALGAAQSGHGVLFISREMSAEDLAERMACDLCFDGDLQIPYSAVTHRQVTNAQAREIARASDRIRDLPLVIEDKRGKTLGSINALVRRHKRRFAAKGQTLRLVVVDYLQLVSPDQREKDLYTRTTEVSKGLKDIAKTNDVGVLALCQLSRAVEQRHDKRPMMSDLRDSGQIEQDADAILFLYAAEYYLMQSEPSDERDRLLAECAHKIEFIVPKRRRGPGGVGIGRFFRQFQAVRG